MIRYSNCPYWVRNAFCTRPHPWFGYGDRHSWGPDLWRSGLLAICRASLRPVGEDIGSSQWLYCDLSSPHTAAVRHPASLQTRLVLPQAMMTAEWIHWLGLFRYTPWGFSTRLPKGSWFGQMANWNLIPDWLRDQLVGAVRESLPYLCWTPPHSRCISRWYNLHHQ